MLNNSGKFNDDGHIFAYSLDVIREVLHELNCLGKNLLLETWSPEDHTRLISKSIYRIRTLCEKFKIEMIRLHVWDRAGDEQLARGTDSRSYLPYDSGLIFTAPKVCLIELGYALKAHGSFNNGNAPVNKIIRALEQMTSVDLGNTSRSFQEIRARKIGLTKYLDALKTSLTERMGDYND
jgi:hypothetical protein